MANLKLLLHFNPLDTNFALLKFTLKLIYYLLYNQAILKKSLQKHLQIIKSIVNLLFIILSYYS